MECMVQGSNPGGGQILRTGPDRPWALPSRLYNGYRVIHVVKWRRSDLYHPPTSSIEVKERVELYLYSRLWTFVAFYLLPTPHVEADGT